MECCGNCGNCKKDRETGEYICTCEASDMYGLEMEYSYTCDEHCDK